MLKRLSELVEQAAADPQDPESRRKAWLIHGFGLSGIAICSVYTAITLMTGERLLGAALLGMLALSAFSLALYRLTHRSELTTAPVMLSLFTLFTYFVISGEANGARLLWSFILPPVAIFALGLRWGALVAAAYTAVAAALILLPWSFVTVSYPFEFKHRWLVSLIFVQLIVALTERSRERAYRRLEQENRARRETEAELKRAKAEAERAAEVKSQFLANMSHELRTPLTSLLGMNSLLLECDLSAEQREYAARITRSGEHLLTIINDVLDLSKMEAGHLRLEQILFDPRALSAEVVESFQPTAQAKGLALSLDLLSEVPGHVLGDPARVKQVLDNLLGNALKFTHRGSVRLELQSSPASKLRARLRWSVVDTGIGVPADKRAAIFQEFQQADGSTTRKYGGTGLGLSICRRLVEHMQGAIGVESNAGEGSRFWFEVPLRNAPQASAPEQAGAPAHPHPRADLALRILLVEDNALSCELVQLMASRLACQLDVASDGEEAITRAAASIYDVILMDCHMPGLDGFAATEQIRAHESACGRDRTPIIALTADVTEENRERCLACDMDDYMIKPFSIDQLSELLGRWKEAARV